MFRRLVGTEEYLSKIRVEMNTGGEDIYVILPTDTLQYPFIFPQVPSVGNGA